MEKERWEGVLFHLREERERERGVEEEEMEGNRGSGSIVSP